MNSKNLILILILTSGLFVNCKNPIEEKCQKFCSLFIDCTKKVIGKPEQLMLFDKKFVNDFNILCEDGCTRVQGDVLTCYEESDKTCESTARCLINSNLDN